MKNLTRPLAFAAVLASLAMAVPAVAAAGAPGSLRAMALRFSQAVLHIPGMTCSNHSCATTVYMSLVRLPGVTGVGVDEATQEVTVKYIPGRTGPAVFLKAVKNAGFPGTLVHAPGA